MDVFRLAPLIVWVGFVVNFLLFPTIENLIMLFGSIFNSFINQVFKLVFESFDFAKRPSPPEDGCGIFPYTSEGVTSGMPSGHAQITSFAATYVLLRWGNPLVFLYLIGVLEHRVKTGCHSEKQVLVGMITGSLFAYLFFHYAKFYRK